MGSRDLNQKVVPQHNFGSKKRLPLFPSWSRSSWRKAMAVYGPMAVDIDQGFGCHFHASQIVFVQKYIWGDLVIVNVFVVP